MKTKRVTNKKAKVKRAKPEGVSINILLDRSGSMQTIKDETEIGLAYWLNEQRKTKVETVVSLYQFDSQFEEKFVGLPIDMVEPIKLKPRAYTALLDSIAKAIEAAEAQKTKKRVLFVVITDGLENASREHTKASVRSLIKAQEAKGWTFVFLGANQDAFLEGAQLGVNRGATLTYNATQTGTQGMYKTLADASTRYTVTNQSGVRGSSCFFTEEDQKKVREEK